MVEQVTIAEGEENPSLEQQAEQQEAQAQPQAETSQERPSWLPEKFTNAEELAKAYGELEKAFSQKNEAPKEEVKSETKPEDLKIQETKTDSTLEPFYNEYAEKGELTEQSYESLNKMGIPKDVVDAYISGQEALAEQHNASLMSSVGGQENYNNMISWAKENLSETEINTFNNTIDNGSLEQAQLAIAGVNARYQANTREPELFSGQKSESNVGYQSVAQMLADINNPKYQTDTAFRQEVEAKVRNSNVL